MPNARACPDVAYGFHRLLLDLATGFEVGNRYPSCGQQLARRRVQRRERGHPAEAIIRAGCFQLDMAVTRPLKQAGSLRAASLPEPGEGALVQAEDLRRDETPDLLERFGHPGTRRAVRRR
jgi:hypothetical protein